MKNLVRVSGVVMVALVLCACGDNLGGGDGDGGDIDVASGDPDARELDAPELDASLQPSVVSTNPANAAMNVPVGARVRATFSRAMDPTTITMTTFTLRQGANPIAGTVTYDAPTFTATFAPAQPLDLSLAYAATVTTGATDAAGIHMIADHVWTFNTGACTQLPVALRTAGSYAILAGSTVTSIGATTVTGDLGVSPGSQVTGFPPGILIGTQHAGDAAAAQAIADLTTAYNDAALRVLCPVAVAGNLGGQTLPPGLYKSTSSLAITSGDLTLDAQGDVNAIFIFQTTSTLMTTSGRQVILSGGARAANVYWQVGTSAAIGTTSMFKGTIMADQQITLATGATLDGRALARIAQVTLQGNAIVRPVD